MSSEGDSIVVRRKPANHCVGVAVIFTGIPVSSSCCLAQCRRVFVFVCACVCTYYLFPHLFRC